jgi:hypothetical protein
MFGKFYSNNSAKQLPQDAQKFSRLGKPIIALENTKTVRLHLPKKLEVNGAHDLGPDHRAPVFPREQL